MIEIKNVKKSVKNGLEILTILNDISLNVQNNEFIAIHGRSGSGKSTLLGIMCGIDKPNSGEVIVDGVNLYDLNTKKLAEYRNKNFGIIFQNFHLISNLSAKENVEIPLLLSKKNNKSNKNPLDLLEMVGLKEKINSKVSVLSGGEQQRVAIARALVQEPKVVFADEPTGSLDYENGILIVDLLMKVRKELNTTVIVVTHGDFILERTDRNILIG